MEEPQVTKKQFTKMAAAVIAALCMTACSTVKTDAPGIQTSVVQITPPATQASVPATQTPAPSTQTPVPSTQTPVPSTQTTAPAAAEYEENTLQEEEPFTVSKTSYSIYLETLDETVYDLRDSRNYGIACIKSNSAEAIDFEGLFGIRLDTTGNTITYSLYTHSKQTSDTASVVLYRVGSKKDNTVVKDLGSVAMSTEKKLSIELSDGLYMLTAAFVVNENNEYSVSGYLYVEDGDADTCRLSNASQRNLDLYIDQWNQLLADADPGDFLSNDKITYPTSGTNGNCNHVSEWEAISDELVLSDNWTDEAKVFAFVDYLAKNVAYDNYRDKQPNDQSRANMAGNYADSKYFTLGNNVGVCWDYTNILTIMCRHHGIACTSIDNERHTFNAVWLNGGWIGIDLTMLNRYACYTEDTNKDNWKSESYSYRCYGGYNITSNMDSYDQNIWTKERGLGLN